MHDSQVEWITALLTFVGRNYGDDALHQALEMGCRAWVESMTGLFAPADVGARVQMFAMACRAHMMPIRIEEDDEKVPCLILKAPQNVREYFEFKELPETERSSETFLRMVHDEYIRVARKLVKTGLQSDIGVQLTDLPKFFPGENELDDDNPFPLEVLARQPLSSEESE